MTRPPSDERVAAQRGRQSLEWMLDMIGDGDTTDHDLAKRFVDAELDIRAALAEMPHPGRNDGKER